VLQDAIEDLEKTLAKVAKPSQLMGHLAEEVSVGVGRLGEERLGADSFDVYAFSAQALSLLQSGEFTPEKLRGYFFRACASTLVHKAVAAGVVVAQSGLHMQL